MVLPAVSRWLFYILGTVFLGALGAGLWDAIMKPTLPYVFGFVLHVATFGLERLRDEVYADVAADMKERASVETWVLINDLIFSFISLTIVFGLVIASLPREKLRAVLTLGSNTSLATLKKVLFGLVLTLGLFTGVVIIHAIRVTYVAYTAAHIQQVEAIVGPYLTQDQRLLVASRVGQMRSRADYDNIIREMEVVAKQHGALTPTFDAF